MADEKSKQIASAVVLAQHGNKSAYCEIYKTYYKKIFFICRAMTGDNVKAIDLTSEIFIKMFGAVDKLGDHMAFEEWFFALAVNLCRGSMTETEDSSVIGEKIPLLASEAVQNAANRDKFNFERNIIKILEEMILHLPAEARVIFFYHYFANMENERIAAIERTDEADIAARVKAVDILLDKQVKKILGYGIDVAMFADDMQNSLLYIASKMFVPDSVHKAVSEAVGVNVNPLSPGKQKEPAAAEIADTEAERKNTKAVKKNFFTKSDLILFLVVLAVSLVIFSGVKIYGKISDKNHTAPSQSVTKKAASVLVWNGAAATSFESGNGTKESPYMIANAAQLAYLANLINDGNSHYASMYYKLTNDIKLNSVDDFASWKTDPPKNKWTPIGVDGDNNIHFSGVFDGGDHTISGLYVSETTAAAGLFGTIDGGSVKNLVIRDSYLKSEGNVGGIVGCFTIHNGSDASISYCGFSGMIESNGANAGGIAGYLVSDRENNMAAVEYCYGAGEIYAATGASGGLVGFGEAKSGNMKMTDCFNTATIRTASGKSGGITGEAVAFDANVLIGNCCNYGKAFASDANGVCGGIAGVIRAGEGNGRINVSQCAMLVSSADADLNLGSGGERLVVSGVRKLSEEEMKKSENHSNLNFSEVWTVEADSTFAYPLLQGVAFVNCVSEEEST